MPQLDFTTFPSQLFWLVVSFILLYLAMRLVALPAVREVLQARQDRIAGDLDKAEAAQKEAEKVKSAYIESLDKARHEAVGLISEASSTIQSKMVAQNAALDADIATRLAAAEIRLAELSREVSSAMEPVSRELTQHIVAKLIGKDVAHHDMGEVMKKVGGL